MKWNKLLYDWHSHPTFGGGGYWKLNKQRLKDVILIGFIIVAIVICTICYFIK